MARRGVRVRRNPTTAICCAADRTCSTTIFPVTTDLLGKGSVEVDMANDICWYHSGGWKKRFDSGLTMLCQTRGFLEFHLRERLLQLPNVTLLQNTKVTGYQATGKRITGVELAGGTTLDADLVIDASGRNSETPRHLSAMGFGSPEVSELKVDIGYSTTLFSPGDEFRDWKGMLIHSAACHPNRGTAPHRGSPMDRDAARLAG